MISIRLDDPQGFTLSASYDHDGQAGRDTLLGLGGWSDSVGARRENLERLGHGNFPTPTTRTGRTLTLDLLLERDSRAELWALERGIAGLFADGGYGTLEVTADGETLYADVTLDGAPKPTVNLDGGYVRAQIPLWSASPYIYGPWRETNVRPAGQGVGLQYPLLAPIISFGTEVSAEDYVWNDGNADSWPVFTVIADTPGGFAVGLGDARVVWPRPTFPDVPVEVDMAGVVRVSGMRQTHMALTRRWGSVAPHSYAVPTFSLLQGGTGFCTVRHRDTYI